MKEERDHTTDKHSTLAAEDIHHGGQLGDEPSLKATDTVINTFCVVVSAQMRHSHAERSENVA